MEDVDFACKTLDMFQQLALEDVDRIRKCVAAGEADNAHRLAHNLKSVASHVSAAKLREIAFEIEQAGALTRLQFITDHLADKLDIEARRCARTMFLQP